MTPSHPRWDEFIERLEGIEGCDFQEENGNITWYCAGGNDKSQATKILRKMNEQVEGEWTIDIQGSLDFFHENGGHCDCEIIFNVEDRVKFNSFKEIAQNQ